MKGIKKLLTGILAATMIMGASLSVCAADVTINRDPSYQTTASGEQTYTYYKMLSAEILEQGTVDKTTGAVKGGKVAYYVDNADQAAALDSLGIFDIVKVETKENYWSVALNKDNKNITGPALAEKLDSIKDNFTGVEVTSQGEKTVIKDLDDGYYLITSSIGDKLIAQTLGENVEINEKNQYPGIKKEEKDKDEKQFVHPDKSNSDEVSVAVGDEIEYQVTVTIPATVVKDIEVTDTMTTGLDLKADTIAIASLTNGTDWEVAETGDRSFKVLLHPTDAVKAAKSVVITFTAVVNKDAVVNNGRKNDVELKYDNYKQQDTVPYVTYKTGIHKVDAADGKPLAGVKFSLHTSQDATEATRIKATGSAGKYNVDPAGTVTVFETDANGDIVITGLDGDATYYFYEEETISGYNLPLGDARFKLVSKANGNLVLDDATLDETKITFENGTGVILPSTGGIGTTIFYIVGGILIVAGIAYFIVRRKNNAE